MLGLISVWENVCNNSKKRKYSFTAHLITQPLITQLPAVSTGKKEIDHVLTRQRDRGLFKSCRIFRGAEAPANTDHLLLVSDLRLKLLKARRKTPTCQAPFDTVRLIQDSALQQQYEVTVENKFDCLGTLPDDVDVLWDSFRSVIRSSADEIIGVRKNIRKPWLSAETFEVIERKAEARLSLIHIWRCRRRG